MTTDEAKAELERILGVSDIRTRDPQWIKFMQEGVLVSVHVHWWRARTALNFEDLGLPVVEEDEKRAFGKLLTLGEKKLLPAETIKAIESCESSGRKAPEAHGFPTHWGTFVPVTNFAAWRAENEKFQQRFYALRDELIANYDNHLAWLAAEYRFAATAAYRRLMRLDDGPRTREQYRDEEMFVLTFLRKIAALVPSKAEISDSFRWEVELEYIPLPSQLAEDKAKADRINRQREIEAIRQMAQRDQALLELDLQQAAMNERQRQLREMNAAVVEDARKRKTELVDRFLLSLAKRLRTLVYDAVSDILESMQKNNGRLGPRSVIQLRNLIENVNELNFFDDREMTASMARVRPLIEQEAKERNVAEIQARLQDIAIVTRASLLALGAEVRKPRSFDIPDVPPADLIRAARVGLSLDELPTPVELPAMARPARVL